MSGFADYLDDMVDEELGHAPSKESLDEMISVLERKALVLKAERNGGEDPAGSAPETVAA